jgi:hypothetical protein
VLHYTYDQILLECQSGIISEAVGFREDRGEKIPTSSYATFERSPSHISETQSGLSEIKSLLSRLSNPRGGLSDPSEVKENCYKEWYFLLKAYSRRSLTFDHDKINAIDGLAKEIASFVDDVQCYGIWRNDLARGLLWVLEKPNVKDYSDPLPNLIYTAISAPSWSWASIKMPMSNLCLFPGLSTNIWKQTTYPGTATIDFSSTSASELQISGLCRHAIINSIFPKWPQLHNQGLRALELAFQHQQELRGFAYVDCEKHGSIRFANDILCLQLGKWESPKNPGDAEGELQAQVCGLLLKIVEDDSNAPRISKAQRVGVFRLLVSQTWPGQPSYSYYGTRGQDMSEGWEWHKLILI